MGAFTEVQKRFMGIVRDLKNPDQVISTIEQGIPSGENPDQIQGLLKSNGLPDNTAAVNRVLKFRLSTDDVDRYGTVFSLRGWKLEEYRQNPVFLYQHNNECMQDSVQMPVGRSIKEYTVLPPYKAEPTKRDAKDAKLDYEAHLRTSPKTADDGTGLYQLVYFPEEKNSEAVFRAYQLKLLNAVSVGAKPDVTILPGDVPKDVQERVGFKQGWFINARVIEGSAVTLPGNPNAIKMALDQGYSKEFLTILGLDGLEERFGPVKSAIRAIVDHGPKLITDVELLNRAMAVLSQNNLELTSKINLMANQINELCRAKPSLPNTPNEDEANDKLVKERLAKLLAKV